MRTAITILCLASVVFLRPAQAAATFEIIGPVFATDVSADGAVVVGNTQAEYETFRWTEETGIVPLGRATVPVLGVGAGVPEVSLDGARVSATILGGDETYATPGRWTLGQGWQETMPPVPADGGLLDAAYGSAWGISDDGETLVGLYWRPGQPGGLAHPMRWTAGTGVVDLGTAGRSGRANAVNADGTVVAGWEERADGTWQPTAWVNGARVTLRQTDGFCEAATVNAAGTIIGGASWIPGGANAEAALWRWDGSRWGEQILGHLPGTTGYVTCLDMTEDGSVVVGYDEAGPAGSSGFIWTQSTGMVEVEDYLVAAGVTIPAGFQLTNLTAVSADGVVMVGMGQHTAPPFATESFMVRMLEPASLPSAGAARAGLRLGVNPTRGTTRLRLDLPRAARARLDIVSASGRLVRRLLDAPLDAGGQDLLWDGRSAAGAPAPSGVYFVRLEAAGVVETRRLVVTR